MEELQSTEILDREILEDARKKAARILKAADDSIKAKAAEWEQKTCSTLDELQKKHEEQRRLAAAEIMARLPMDKRRAKAEKIENLLCSAVGNWYAGLSRGQVCSILVKELTKRLAVCGEFTESKETLCVLIHQLDRMEAESVLREALPEGPYIIEEKPSAALYPEIILSNDKARISASIQKTVDYFLREKRAELALALLGQDFLEGEAPVREGAS
jgi:vacuolar-type H+-ATPase subunit E/Vma4